MYICTYTSIHAYNICGAYDDKVGMFTFAKQILSVILSFQCMILISALAELVMQLINKG